MRHAFLLAGLTLLLLPDRARSEAGPTYQQIATIAVEGSVSTFCMAPDGRLLVVGPAGDGAGSVRVYSGAGELEATWPIPFAATAINVSPRGEVFVAGAGQAARLNGQGAILKQGPTPQINDTESFRQQVREQLVQTRQERARQIELQARTAADLVASLSEKPESERTAIDKVRLRNAQRQTEMLQRSLKQNSEAGQADVNIDAYLAAKLRVPGLAVSEDDIFVAVSSLKGYGYDVWRMDHDFYNPKLLVEGLRGCCGQMDIQSHQGELYVAENSRHRVVRYDRDGKELASWGKSDRSGKDGFEGCCNPMNLRFGQNGEVLTAESGCGAVKRYSPDGEYLGLVGNADLVGGCKHVAIAASPDASRIFMLDITRSRIAVLGPAKSAD